MKILLASSSPRRRLLLELTGRSYRVVNPRVLETKKTRETPRSTVLRLARLKAEWALPRVRKNEVVLGADTLVVLRGRIFGKPKNLRTQTAMLRKLSGKTHRVLTGIALWRDGVWTQRAATSRVQFRRLTAKAIKAYTSHGEALDCAGGYMIQGLGAALVHRVEGSLSNVIGLPLELLERLLGLSGKMAS